MDVHPSSGVLFDVLMAGFCSFPFSAHAPHYYSLRRIIFIFCVTSTHTVEPEPPFALEPHPSTPIHFKHTTFDTTSHSVLFVPPYHEMSSRLDILPTPPFHTCICPNNYFFLCLSFPGFCCQCSANDFVALPRPRRLNVVASSPQSPPPVDHEPPNVVLPRVDVSFHSDQLYIYPSHSVSIFLPLPPPPTSPGHTPRHTCAQKNMCVFDVDGYPLLSFGLCVGCTFPVSLAVQCYVLNSFSATLFSFSDGEREPFCDN